MASLGNLTNKVASKVGSAAVSATKTVGGVAGAIAAGTYNTVKRGFMNATDIDQLRPRNIAAGALDSVGLGAIMPAFGKDPRRNEAVQAAQRVADQNKATGTSFKPMEEMLNKLIGINEKILENSNALLDYAKKQTNLLDTSNDLVKKQTLQDIENMREAKKPSSANDNKVGAAPANDNKKSGGFLDGIMNSVKGILGSLGPVGAFLSSVGSIFAKLARFVMTLNPLMLVALAAIASLHMEDFAKMFDNLAKVFDDLANGKILDGIVRLLGSIADIVFKAIGRLVANILSFFGADEMAKDLNKWLDNLNIADKFVEWLHAITDWLSEIGPMLADGAKWIGKKIGNLIAGVWDTISGTFGALFKDITDSFEAFSSGDILKGIIKMVYAIPNALIQWIGRGLATVVEFFGGAEIAKTMRDWLNNFNLADTIVDFFKNIQNWVVEKFTNMTKAFSDWWNSFSVIEPILSTFESVKNSIVEKFDNVTKSFSDWWNSFSLTDLILTPFNFLKDTATSVLDNFQKAISDWWGSFSIIDIVLTPFNYLKDTATALFDNLQKEIANILSFDLVGKIGESVGSVVNGVWNFFKALPSKAMDLISDVVPDSLKGFFKSMFGSSETVAPTAPVTRSSEARPALTPRNMGLAIQDSSVNASPSDRNQQFNQQSAQMVASQSAPPPPVIINNSTNTNTGGGGGQGARTSGAVHTAPQSSHIDRALYGDFYGAGVP
jgi:hypothetical protein